MQYIFEGAVARSLVADGRLVRMLPPVTIPEGRSRMSFQTRLLCAAAVSGLAAFAMTAPAQALSMQECGAKYQNAKTAGTLNGQDWKTFRKTQCAAADATPAAAPAAAPA